MISAASIVRDLEGYVYQAVKDVYGEKIALACAKALFDCLFLNFRKQTLYIPTTGRDDIEQRNQAIWQDFSGHNHAELSLKYHLTLQQIYAIVKRMRKQDIQQRQLQLFPLPEQPDARPQTLQVFDDYLPDELQRAGIPAPEHRRLAQRAADYLCARYPGLSIRITEQLHKDRQPSLQSSLF